MNIQKPCKIVQFVRSSPPSPKITVKTHLDPDEVPMNVAPSAGLLHIQNVLIALAGKKNPDPPGLELTSFDTRGKLADHSATELLSRRSEIRKCVF